MAFNENTRVKIPAILHLCRLGYKYLALGDVLWDESSNIATTIFLDSIKAINPGIDDADVGRLFKTFCWN